MNELQKACINGSLVSVKYILAAASSTSLSSVDAINQELDKTKMTPFLLAVRHNHEAVVKHLVANGANINHITEDGRSAAFIASTTGNAEIMDLLCKNGADLSISNEHGVSPLISACSWDHVKVIEAMLPYASLALLNHRNKQGWSALFTACHNGHLEITKLLLAAGADPNLANNEGESPLFAASENGHEEVVGALLQSKASLIQVDRAGNTALAVACKNNFLEICVLLVQHGAFLNAKNNDGNTCLHLAVEAGAAEVTDWLLGNENIHFDCLNKAQKTPLMIAFDLGDLEAIKSLVSKGSDVNRIEKKRWTKLYTASLSFDSPVPEKRRRETPEPETPTTF